MGLFLIPYHLYLTKNIINTYLKFNENNILFRYIFFIGFILWEK